MGLGERWGLVGESVLGGRFAFDGRAWCGAGGGFGLLGVFGEEGVIVGS